jgi:hypothetical protein
MDTETLEPSSKIKSNYSPEPNKRTNENHTNENHTPEKNSDFPSIVVDLIKKINFKTAIFLFIIGIFIFSDTFIENVLPSKFVYAGCTNSKGTVIQMLLLVFSYIFIDLMVSNKML